ncbi:MAG: hypothetical protein IPK39_18450 [Sulfuritalea sp.]|nr:hypothetical protein [Sulfuritalea sp.]
MQLVLILGIIAIGAVVFALRTVGGGGSEKGCPGADGAFARRENAMTRNCHRRHTAPDMATSA